MTITLITSTGKRIPVVHPGQIKSATIQPCTVVCSSCAVAVINGLICHETGCPEAWKSEIRECRWCGSQFQPESKGQGFCSNDCRACYNGWDHDPDRQTAEDDTSP